MGWKGVLVYLLAVLLVLLLFFYWILPLDTIDFGTFTSKNSNFSIDGLNTSMQFYENMRYPERDISYRINQCNLQKEDEMKVAFDIIDNLTSVDFYPVGSNEEIFVTCDERA